MGKIRTTNRRRNRRERRSWSYQAQAEYHRKHSATMNHNYNGVKYSLWVRVDFRNNPRGW